MQLNEHKTCIIFLIAMLSLLFCCRQACAQTLPSGWSDGDVGSVGVAGSGAYSNGTFTVKASGQSIWNTADGMNFAYQTLSGDGTIVARLLTIQGGANSQTTGVMIRETLDPSSKHVYVAYGQGAVWTVSRTSTGGSTSGSSLSTALPYWVKLTRSGSSFSGFASSDGLNWVQVGSTQTVSMAQNVYIGLAVSSNNNSALSTATLDNVSVNSSTTPAPAISTVSTNTGSAGTQVVITGSGFGASQGTSVVLLNGTAATVSAWSATSVTITIPSGATSGPLAVLVAPTMNASNPVVFTITSQPLPSPWLDWDVGSVGVAGSGTYSNGTFTVKASGQWIWSTADGMNFVYQNLSGDGTIIARLLSIQGGANSQSTGVMIRETLNADSTNFYGAYGQATIWACPRTTTGGSTTCSSLNSIALPYWVKVTRSGSSFAGYASADGIYWTQVGSSTSISMAQTVYVGLAVSSNRNSVLATATFDNVSFSAGTPATPVITAITPTSGTVGTSVTISGSNFGATQGTSSVRFNGAAASSITSWSNTQIIASPPTTASTGPLTVIVNGTGSNRDFVFSFYNPVLTSATPPSAAVGGSIQLAGSGFGASQGSSQVKFNGLVAGVNSWSDTAITATVPSNATTGPITVTVGGFPSNGVQFTVIPPVSVTAISPTSGPIGTTVTITGNGFGNTQSNSIASFYGGTANVTSWSNTSIVATVPAGASTGNVTVTVAGNTGQGPVFSLGSALTLSDSLGNSSTYNAQVSGGQWRVTDSQGAGCSTCTQRGMIHSVYDSHGNLQSNTDELGHTTSYVYDNQNNLVSASKPDGQGHTLTTSYTYNSFGEVLTVTDPLGFVTTNTYDTHGNLLTVTTPRPDGNTNASVTQFAYDSKGELTSITDPLNHVTTLAYTPAGLIQTITDAQNHVTTYGYDTHGNRTSVTDALNHQTQFAYDTGDRLKTITYPDTTTTTFNYDSRGRRTSVTDQNGKTTTSAYDDADRLLTVTDAANNVTTYTYDTESNLKSIKDANNQTTSFDYDAFGRVTKTTFPSGYIETYNYDAVGNLLNKTDRKNQLITYTYDQLNRLTQKSYPDTSTVNYTYDLDSRQTQVTDPTGTYQFTFDNMGRLTSASASYTFLTARSFTTGYSYDAASNRTGFTDPENGSTTYVYDTLNRLQTLTPPTAFSGTGSFGFGYDALSRRTQMTRPNNITTNYSYDNLSRLLSVLHQSGATTLDGASYTVDSAGNRTAKTNQQSGVTSNYTYDPIYELTKVMQAANTTENYTYDPVGNRLTSLSGSYGYNSSNQLTTSPTAAFTYDYNGNTLTSTTGSNTTTYAWDYENRLTSVTLPGSGGTVSFKYDPFGRRIQKSSSSGTSIYAYEGDNLIEETNSGGAVVARYSQWSIDEPLAMLRSGATNYYEADGLGTITSLTNAAGAVAQTYTFDSFGKQTASSGSLTNPFQYTAREFDSETGLYFYRARYFDPVAGRFLSEDPTGFNAGMDFYAYVSNSPTNLVDPKGLLQVCCRPAHQSFAQVWAKLTLQPPPCHCFLKLSDGHTLGGYFSWSLSNFGSLVTGRDDNTDYNKYAPEAKCSPVPGAPCENDAKAKKAFGSPRTLGSYGFGSGDAGTSNDAAAGLLKDAGIGYNLPTCAWGKGPGPEGSPNGVYTPIGPLFPGGGPSIFPKIFD